ncbi:uncharacterized protein BDW70DRAFT_125798 [Aspergillus foveolatus]|uniref:uncharacterized protein n=1 Tax=Aspergillus foveolatus TaxID=210207 RepID=UPI003CCD120F
MQFEDRFEYLASGYEYQCIGVGVRYPGFEGRLCALRPPVVVMELAKIPGANMTSSFKRPSQLCSQRICPVSYTKLVYSHFPLFYYLSRVFHDWPYDKCV